MKKTITFLTFLFTQTWVLAQSFLPEVVPEPLTGFNKINNDNPFVMTQIIGTDNLWYNLVSYTWIPADIPGYKKEKSSSQFMGDTWVQIVLEQNTFTGDAQKKLLSAIQETTIDYGSTIEKTKLKYQYTYNSNQKHSYILVQQALPASSSNFKDYYNINYTYDNTGLRIKDSTYYYTTSTSKKRFYLYNGSNLQTLTEIDGYSGDTLNLSFYTFVDNRMHTSYTLTRNQTSDILEPLKTDTLEYDENGNILRHVSFGLYDDNGQLFPFTPLKNEEYTYDSSGQMKEMFRKSWDYNQVQWVNVSKTVFTSEGDIPRVGYRYGWNSGLMKYDQNPSVRFLFNLLTGLPYHNDDTKSDVMLYPNPAKNKVNMAFPSIVLSYESVNYEIYNMKGELVSVPVLVKDGIAEFDVSNLQQGIYQVRLISGDHVITKKLLVE